jgi:hypothetical protein
MCCAVAVVPPCFFFAKFVSFILSSVLAMDQVAGGAGSGWSLQINAGAPGFPDACGLPPWAT